MTASQSCKSARHARRLTTGHGRARPDIRHPQQIARQFVEPDAIRRAFISRFTAAQFVASAQFQSASLPAALKSP
jgi:hypothetical protein